MESILVTARYTIIKCIRNPLAVIAFIAAPLLVTYMVTGSMDNNLSTNLTKSQVEESRVNLQNNIINPNETAVSTNDKAAMASIILFVFYGAVLSTNLIIHDLKNGINDRLKSMPTTKINILLGKSLGNMGTMGIFAFTLIIITTYFFDVNWGENKLKLFAAMVLFLIIENSFGIIITGLSKNIYICALVAFAVNFFMVGPVYVGAFSPIKISGIIKIVDTLSFHSYVVKAITAGSGEALIVLCASAVIMFFISLVVGKKVIS